MKRTLLNTATLWCIILLVQACSSTKNTSLYNSRWELNEVQGVVIDYMVNPKAEIYLTFDEAKNQFNGSTGCNTIAGKLTVNENKMNLSELSSTKMACEKMRAERLYLSLLESVDNYKLRGSTLTLYQGQSEVASYTRSKLPVPATTAPTN
ncbi:META domain-containing protein [Solitalea sp. MAHUQ-68]|uniref:META domain-containing protein n=1 Tax=Solitalea agri TaxID=2953739 RepID=A0A9X2F2A5_9SPHI|nr:META domain-containing protein [Solitalea agri]MCO4292875.1 META domain-containing protein [Solitalea agri]